MNERFIKADIDDFDKGLKINNFTYIPLFKHVLSSIFELRFYVNKDYP